MSEASISSDVQYLREQAKGTIEEYVTEHLPEQYQVCLCALDTILKHAFNILETSEYNREKLQAMELFKAIPQISQNKDLAWELLTIMVQPNILSPWLQRYAYLPTQNTIGSGPYSAPLNQTIPYYDKMVSMIPIGRARPSIPEYPQIAEHIMQAIYEVERGVKSPTQAMNDAAFKSAKVLGW